jgi:hypothetical protein
MLMPCTLCCLGATSSKHGDDCVQLEHCQCPGRLWESLPSHPTGCFTHCLANNPACLPTSSTVSLMLIAVLVFNRWSLFFWPPALLCPGTLSHSHATHLAFRFLQAFLAPAAPFLGRLVTVRSETRPGHRIELESSAVLPLRQRFDGHDLPDGSTEQFTVLLPSSRDLFCWSIDHAWTLMRVCA